LPYTTLFRSRLQWTRGASWSGSWSAPTSADALTWFWQERSSMRAGNIFLSTCSLLGAVSVAGQARAADPNLRIAVHDGACVVTEGVPLQGDALALEAAQPLTKREVRWESGATVEVDGEGTGWIIRRPQGKQAQKGILEFAFMDAGTEKTVECAERTLFEAVRTGK